MCIQGTSAVKMEMNTSKFIATFFKVCLFSFYVSSLVACDSKNKEQQDASSNIESEKQQQTEILPFLNIQEQPAKYALPFCEKKNCIEMDIQTIQTQDAWMNQWIAESQSHVIQNQIGLNQAMTLQQAINAYVKKSDAWQAEFKTNHAYELHLNTRIASQRNQYVLLQVIVNSKQQSITVKDRGYFFVADRKLQKKLSLLDVIQNNQQNALNEMIQVKYTEWQADQSSDVQKAAPKKLYWGQSDWFFDGEGVGLHYRANEIVKDGTQLDIYLTKEQTAQVLRPEVLEKMF